MDSGKVQRWEVSHTLNTSMRPISRAPLDGWDIRGVLCIVDRALLALGLVAIGVLTMMLVDPMLIGAFTARSPFSPRSDAGHFTDAKPIPERHPDIPSHQLVAASPTVQTEINGNKLKDADVIEQQQVLTAWLSKRYHVATDAIRMLVSTSYAAAAETTLDPLLILAVISTESKFNPFAEGACGARGLMQVRLDDYPDTSGKATNAKDVLDPTINIRLGSRGLKRYLLLGGSVESALNKNRFQNEQG